MLGINLFITIANPVIPPAAKLFGAKKYSTDIATKIIPIVIRKYSFIVLLFIFLNTSSNICTHAYISSIKHKISKNKKIGDVYLSSPTFIKKFY